MWPTSIAVWKRSAPPQFGQRSPSFGTRMSAKRASKSRPASTPRRCQPVAVRAGDELPVAQRLVGDDLAVEADRAERAAGRRRTPRGSRPPSRAGRPRRARRAASPPRAGRRRARARARPCRRPSSTGIAFDVAAASIAEELGERLDRRRRPASRPPPARRAARGKLGRARDRRARPRGRRRSRRSRT